MIGLSKAYSYDLNKYYAGIVDCQEDPLASIAEGKTVYLLPANATYKEPLPEKENFKVKWNGTEWEYEDHTPHQPTPEERIRAEIERLKAELSATDYKIIKCSEYSLNGQELPYDIAELHAQRQALRDRINELEELLPQCEAE